MTKYSKQERGYAGEQHIGFILGAEGYFFVNGPGGAKGHQVNASGFDGVAFNPKTRHLIIYDNKSYKRTTKVSGASALDKNLEKNLEHMIKTVLSMTQLPSGDEIVALLKQAHKAIQSGGNLPNRVMIAISNAGGQSTGVGGKLAKKKVQFIDVYK